MESLKRNCQAPTELTIKIGAQVELYQVPVSEALLYLFLFCYWCIMIFSDCSNQVLFEFHDWAFLVMQVMLLKNLDLEAGLCNGSRGVVIDFKEQSPDEQASRTARERLASAGFFNVPIVRFANGVEVSLVYIPL